MLSFGVGMGVGVGVNVGMDGTVLDAFLFLLNLNLLNGCFNYLSANHGLGYFHRTNMGFVSTGYSGGLCHHLGIGQQLIEV